MCRLTPDELDACREQARRANRMEVCRTCGTPFEDAPVSGGDYLELQREVSRDLDRGMARWPLFFDVVCPACRAR